MHNVKDSLILNVKNILGQRIARKVVVIECDDWGSIRMPNLQTYNEMIKKGILLSGSRFNRYDTLAGSEDLEQLFQVLKSVRDKNNKPAVMTAVCNMANPDFVRIKDSDYSQYYFEPFTVTLEKYYPNDHPFKLWEVGMKDGIFVTELHGREHLSVQLWFDFIKRGDKKVHDAFRYNFTSVDVPSQNRYARGFRPELFFESDTQIPFLKDAIGNGIALFEKIFKRKPTLFVPSNGIYHPCFNETLVDGGVKFVNVQYLAKIPDGKGGVKTSFFRNGKKDRSGLSYYARNCAFEPTDKDYRGADYTIRQIEAAFKWNKPAIISTHRVNFVGMINPENRDRGLDELHNLLNKIVKKWPEVEFLALKDILKN